MPTPPSPYHCPACRRDVAAFAPGPGGRRRAKCPHCRSLGRHRFLAYLFNRLAPVVGTARLVLDIAPQTAVQDLLRALTAPDRYLGLDLSTHRRIDVCASVELLPLPDGVVDFAVCYHVLEHVVDDEAAIAELARVLSPGGLLVLQVPIQRGRATEHDPHASPERLLERFGHRDHRRLYGDDFEARLAKGGLAATITYPSDYVAPEEGKRFGLNNQPVWLCRVARGWGARPPAELSAEVLRLHRPPPQPDVLPPPDALPPQAARRPPAAGRGLKARLRGVPGYGPARRVYRALRSAAGRTR